MTTNILFARQDIIRYARRFLGSHYLWGAGGSTPGASDGIPHRRASVTLEKPSLDPAKPCVFAAACDASGSKYVCAGRYKNFPGGRFAWPTDWDLQNYLEGLKGTDPALWKPFCNYFSPRKIVGENVAAVHKQTAVWGEDCRGVRHFDCIYFVNYVLTGTTILPFYQGKRVESWSRNIEQWFNGTQRVKLEDRVEPADLLFKAAIVDKSNPNTVLLDTSPELARFIAQGDKVESRFPNGKLTWTHIAFLGGDGSVVQAQEAVKGVHADESYSPGNWVARGRLSTSSLQEGQWA